MNIIARKLIFNEAELHLMLWKDKQCFFVSEISHALDSASKEDISTFLRYGGAAVKGQDYDVVQGTEARDMRSYLENSGLKKRFAHAMIIYLDGLMKYFEFRRTVEIRDFKSYLIRSKVLQDTPSETHIKAESPSKSASNISLKEQSTEGENRSNSKKDVDYSYNGYSDFLKHISFMEEFVSTFNSINISPDKSIAFTKSMVKFLEDNNIKVNKFLQEVKKWIV